MIKAAVLGKPVAHSLSPLVHGEIYRRLGLQYSYQRLEHDEVSAMKFLTEAFESGDWSGFSLTMPLKEVAFSLNLACEPRAVAAYSVNTITPGRGFNTDITGLLRVFEHAKSGLGDVAIIGSGATARSVLVTLSELKRKGQAVGEVKVFRRSSSRDSLLLGASEIDLELSDLQDFVDGRSFQSVISTVPSMAQGELVDSMTGFGGLFFDVTYSPWPSPVAQVATGEVISGLSLLVAQAVDQAALFTGLDFNRDEMYHEVKDSTDFGLVR